MFSINEDMSIYVTRGDVAFFSVRAYDGEEPHTFKAGDVIRIKVFEKKNCGTVAFSKVFGIAEDALSVEIFLSEADTRIGEVISKPVDYWYEIELNPFTDPQTIIGYDDDGAKIFRLFPEGADVEYIPPAEGEASGVDAELSLTSENPIQNQAVASAMLQLERYIKDLKETSDTNVETVVKAFEDLKSEFDSLGVSWEKIEETAREAAIEAVGDTAEVFYWENIAVSVTGWLEDEVNGGFYQTVAAEGMFETDKPDADVLLGSDIAANELYLGAWSCVTRISAGENSVTLWANKTAPTVSFQIHLKVVR